MRRVSGGPVVPDIRAVWQANTVFSPGDVFTYLGGVYEVTATYTSGGSFGATDLANTTLWEAQSGTYALPPTVVTKTSAYTAAYGDLVLADASAGAFAVTLPAVASGKQKVTVKKKDSSTNAVTVSPQSGTIDGSASIPISTLNVSRDFITDGTNWYQI